MKKSVLLLMMGLAACTLHKTPVISGGSQVDGIVRMSYELPPLQRATVDSYLAQSTASRQCQNWGFANAVPYGQPITTCSLISGSSCMNETVTLEYQCQGISPVPYGTTTVGGYY